jgi:hypothetical protein
MSIVLLRKFIGKRSHKKSPRRMIKLRVFEKRNKEDLENIKKKFVKINFFRLEYSFIDER